MNPQRLVAAVAALAIGFGVTIIGVGFADDEPAGDSQVDQEVGGLGGGEGEVEAAEQQAEAADEPGAAEVDVPDASPTEPSVQQGESQEGTPVQPPPTSAPLPQDANSCQPAVIIVGVDGRVVVLAADDVRFGSDQSGEEVALLRISGESVDAYTDIVANADIVNGAFEGSDNDRRFIDCSTNAPIEEMSPDTLRGDLLDAASGSDSFSQDAALDFPCDSNFIEDFAANAGLTQQLERVREREATDVDIMRFFIASRVARVSAQTGTSQNDTASWEEVLAPVFVGFRTDANFEDACDLLDENVTLDDSTREGFFCAIGQLSSDQDLLELLEGQVPVESGCRYPPIARTGSATGNGSPDEDEGDN